MQDPALLDIFVKFGLAALLGFLIGLEREMTVDQQKSTGLRDFVLFALFGAVSAFTAQQLENDWIAALGLLGVVVLLLSGYWARHRTGYEQDVGITTEIAAVLTFFLGVLVVEEAATLSIALAIIILVVLSKKQALTEFRSHIQRYELEATLKLLVITFIILPILPNQPLSGYLTLPMGKVISVDEPADAPATVSVELVAGQNYSVDDKVNIYDSRGRTLGTLTVASTTPDRMTATYDGDNLEQLVPDTSVRAELGIRFLSTMLEAIVPYKVWLIVVLVSFISFVGYGLVKVLGSSAGSGLTGLVGGLASSTVTTLSFAKRSLETPAWNRYFAVAVILASSIMFPRLIVQMAFVNQALMKNIAAPLCVMGVAGFAVAAFYYFRSKSESAATESLQLANPFSLGSALKFGLVFAATLMVTRLAITYLGEQWLPLVAIVSGLTDADAIAFSVSNGQQAGLITLDWASFNLVLGALSNTFMKLFLVLFLGHRGLFKQLLLAFLVIGATGIVTMFLYYDLSTVNL
ncbi:MAG: MgtC/SapB family protein [Pirellulaceae bacterium]|nr:MgtC/SapB family protein [Pirellulaceae bacterium]